MKFEVVNILADGNDAIEILSNLKCDVLCLPCYVWNRKKALDLVEHVNISEIIWGGSDVSESLIQEVNDRNKNYFIIGKGEENLSLY